jgi:hypothetical protein
MHCCWCLLQCFSWNLFAIKCYAKHTITRGCPKGRREFAKINYAPMYRLSCAIHCYCFCGFHLSFFLISYVGLDLGSSQFSLLHQVPHKPDHHNQVNTNVSLSKSLMCTVFFLNLICKKIWCAQKYLQRVSQIYISKASCLFSSQFWPLLNWASFLKAAGAVV